MTEIGERNDGAPADPRQFQENGLGIVDRRQGLAQDDVVEGLGRVGLKVGVGVALDDRETLAYAGVDAGVADLQAAAIDPFEVDQVVEQRSVAAAHIKHTAFRSHHVGDDLQVDADRA